MDLIQFFSCKCNISRSNNSLTLNKIHRFIQNCMPYKLIRCLPHKCVYQFYFYVAVALALTRVSQNLNGVQRTLGLPRYYLGKAKIEFPFFAISPWITQQIYVEMKHTAHHVHQLIELALMMYIAQCTYIYR